MAGDSRGVMKVCRDCKLRRKGTPAKLQWCDNCGGEMVTIGYANKRRVRRDR